jgi:hypothetical protein
MDDTDRSWKDLGNEVKEIYRNTNEIWKDIEGYEGIYQVSNKGRVKSLARKSATGLNLKGRFLKHCVVRQGYAVVALYKNRKRLSVSVKRLVAKAFIPNPKNKPRVISIDRDAFNNETWNLKWVTASEHIQYEFDTSIRVPPVGAARKCSKLTEKIVAEIRKSNLKQVQLSEMYGVNQSTISSIQLGKTWKHI